MRAEFFGAADGQHPTIAGLQHALDGWVQAYNTERPHQSLGMAPPVARFALLGPTVSGAGGQDVVDPRPLPGLHSESVGSGSSGAAAGVDGGAAVDRCGWEGPVGRVQLPGADRVGWGTSETRCTKRFPLQWFSARAYDRRG